MPLAQTFSISTLKHHYPISWSVVCLHFGVITMAARKMIDLAHKLFICAKNRAAIAGISLREFLVQVIQQKLTAEKKKVRRAPPAVGSADGPRIGILTPEQIDEAIFG
jgi:hypothetical protein